ncbi:MAG: DNA polymerase IV [Spirochaetales bacterium]|nr:DNA polymerase IV [Spirochaetales bacterium]
MCSCFFHVDLDAFFASVEQEDQPQYKGRPVIVGADPQKRGVVSACSYEARKFGIHSAMPISEAFRRCPQGVFLPVRMERYHEISEKIMAALKNYTPHFIQISVDEASLDLSGMEKLFGPPREVAWRIKEEIRELTGLTLSVGIAPNRYLAKLASEYEKPNGLTQILPGQEESFVNRLELRELWGVGPKTLDRLKELNIRNVVELRAYPQAALKAMIGEAMADFLHRVIRGQSPAIHENPPKSHSVSAELTFEQDCKNREVIKKTLLSLSQQLMTRLMNEEGKSRTLVLKVRTFDFSTSSVRKTYPYYISSSETMYKNALDLLDQKWDSTTPLRLIGLGFAQVEKEEKSFQGELFEEARDKAKRLEEAVFDIKKKWNGVSLTKASLLSRKAQDKNEREKK